jgi:hypothetical protein
MALGLMAGLKPMFSAGFSKNPEAARAEPSSADQAYDS